MISITKHLQNILQRAAKKAMPELIDPIVVTPEKNKDWDYVSPSAIKFFNMHKKKGSFGFGTCNEMAQAIADNLGSVENDAIERVDLSKAGNGPDDKSGFFLNITLKNSFIEQQIRNVYM